jgi:hypothetical protein
VEDAFVDHLRERDDATLDELTACGTYSNRHIRLDRNELLRWRRLRVEARRDLPLLTGTAQLLDRLVFNVDPSTPGHDEIAEKLAAVRRRIEESKRRFSIG